MRYNVFRPLRGWVRKTIIFLSHTRLWTSTRSVKLFTITRSVWDNDSVFRHANPYKVLNASELDNFETDGANNCYCGIWYLVCNEKSVDYPDCDFFLIIYFHTCKTYMYMLRPKSEVWTVSELAKIPSQNPKYVKWTAYFGFSQPIRGVARNPWPVYEVKIQGWPIWGIRTDMHIW